MTGPGRSRHLRRASWLRIVLAAVLGLALIAFAMPNAPSDLSAHGEFDAHAHPRLALHASGPHHAPHDASHDGHAANAMCAAACAATIAPLAERGPEFARARGVPPAIMARIDEHNPEDPLPPPRRAAAI